MLETKSSSLEIEGVSDTGEITGYASVFGVIDGGRDVVEKGAFSSLSRTPRMLWGHDPSRPIGVWTEAKEDDRGLLVKGKIVLETQAGKEAHALAKAGAINGLSIGFSTKNFKRSNGVRRLTEVDLWEVSLVTFPMNPEAQITSVKSSFLEIKEEIENILHNAGFSSEQSEAAIAAMAAKLGKRDDAATIIRRFIEET